MELFDQGHWWTKGIVGGLLSFIPTNIERRDNIFGALGFWAGDGGENPEGGKGRFLRNNIGINRHHNQVVVIAIAEVEAKEVNGMEEKTFLVWELINLHFFSSLIFCLLSSLDDLMFGRSDIRQESANFQDGIDSNLGIGGNHRDQAKREGELDS